MKKLIFLLLFLITSSCMAVEIVIKTTFDELVASTSKYNEKEVFFTAFITVQANDRFILHTDKEVKNFLDLVFIENDFDFELLQTNIQKCAQVRGVFKEYNRNFVGMGNLTSDFGLIELTSISFCDKRS